MRRLLYLSLAISVGCGDDSGNSGPIADYRLPTDVGTVPHAGQMPFPSDVYAAGAGGFAIPPEALPFDGVDAEAGANLSAALTEQACFGLTAGVSFPIANLDDGESIDLDSARSAARLRLASDESEIPVEVTVRPEGIVVVEPIRGVVLDPGARYVASLGALDTTEGRPIAASSTFERVRDGDPTGPWQQHVAEALGPHLAGDEIAATSFTTCDASAQLEAIAAQLDALAPAAAQLDRIIAAADLDALLGTPDDNTAPGIDNPGGPAHAGIGFVVLGRFDAPSYLADTPATQGRFELDADGAPIAKGTESIPFILVLPQIANTASDSAADLPVVIYQHGINAGSREIFAVANTLATRGLATIAIDMPFHGARFPDARDREHNFSDTEGPDGIADGTGATAALYFFDIQTQPHVTWLDPRIMTASFRQAAVDVMSLARLLDGGDWSAIAEADPDLADLSFRGGSIAFASESFGGFVGVPAVAFEPRLAGGFFSVGGGGLTTELLEASPVYGPLFSPILQGAFGVGFNEVLPSDAPPHTHYLYQMLAHVLDAADPLTYAGRAAARGVPLVLPMAHLDEAVPNTSSEALAAALGLAWQPEAGERETPSFVTLPAAEPGATTGIAFARDPATHGMLSRATDDRKFVKEGDFFETLDPPIEIANPIAELQGSLADFAQLVSAANP
jgi:hypothetical protein